MANNIYIGNRYVPIFANPVEWDNLRTYEPLTIVTYHGTSYTSRKAVPVGIALSNTEYWVVTGNYNAYINELQEQLDTINSELGNIINEDTTYNEDTTLNGFNYSLNNSKITSNHVLTVGDIDNLEITGNNIELLHCSNSSKISNSKIDNSGDIGIHHNSSGSNILINDNEIESSTYATLINGSATGSGAIITDNFIHSNEGDAVELNNPNGSFSNNIVANNVLNAGSDGGSGHANGFSVGAAHVINGVINGNVSDYSRNEAVHIEDRPDKLIVSDNIFDNCHDGGIIFSQGYGSRTQDGKLIVHSNNYYSADSGNTQTGCYNVYAGTDEDYIVIDENNFYENFQTGILNIGSTTIPHIRIYNDYIRNSVNGLITDLNTYGRVIIDNCTNCVVIGGNGRNIILEDLMIINGPAYDHIITFTGSNSTAIIKKIAVAKHISNENNISVLPKAYYAKGTLTLTANFGSTRAIAIYDITGTTLTELLNDTYGAEYLNAAFSTNSLDVVINNSMSGELTVNFEGCYIVKQ